jgi:hypothetical protein
MYTSLVSTGDESTANHRLLDMLRQVQTFGLSLMKLDIRQESTRHAEVRALRCACLGVTAAAAAGVGAAGVVVAAAAAAGCLWSRHGQLRVVRRGRRLLSRACARSLVWARPLCVTRTAHAVCLPRAPATGAVSHTPSQRRPALLLLRRVARGAGG